MANIGTTNTPAISWTTSGPVAPSGPALLAGIQQDWDVAFNVTFNWQGSTPQGQLVSSQAAALAYCNQTIVYYATQVDPAYATGRMQDAIARIRQFDLVELAGGPSIRTKALSRRGFPERCASAAWFAARVTV